ncbi:MAG: dicarboxylate/amino acid:cation symporter [Rhodothermia bacterium]|nr:MAG: dicarboxylate/amino acid:cation symporter [Rhodothermia bacterium]
MATLGERVRAMPGYVWTLLALSIGILLGGVFPQTLAPLAQATTWFIQAFIKLVPILIFAALSPAVAKLVRRGRAGKFGGAVLGWYLLSSILAGLFGLTVSALLFDIPFSSSSEGAWAEVQLMLSTLGNQGGASLPLLAIIGAVFTGIVAVKIEPLFAFLARVEARIGRSGPKLSYVLVPIIFFLGISIGVRFGARLGMAYYLTMTLYTVLLCLFWWLFYLFVVLKGVGRQPLTKVLKTYYFPVAVFAAGTSSSLVTLPVNLAYAKKYGVRDEAADFIIPFGAVINLDASALAYVAYAPFVLSYIFGIETSWVLLLAAWPAIVLFTIAAPGLPAGIGTALWSATLFAGMVGLEEPLAGELVTTWVALSSGLPDMFRTATNCTSDGFTSIVFSQYYDKYFSSRPTT